jgi:transcriptional regulator
MYIQDLFAVTDAAEVEAMLGGAGLGCLVTHDAGGLFASHLPFVYDAGRGTLSGHIARANPHWERAGEGEALAIFRGADAYISPSWYPSKSEHGRVVPTWNYEAVHVHGRLTWRHDEAWLLDFLNALTDRHEAAQAKPWSVADAPEKFTGTLVRSIVGLELSIDRIEAKRKLSQNRPEADRLGVIAGLSASASLSDRQLAAVMAGARND